MEWAGANVRIVFRYAPSAAPSASPGQAEPAEIRHTVEHHNGRYELREEAGGTIEVVLEFPLRAVIEPSVVAGGKVAIDERAALRLHVRTHRDVRDDRHPHEQQPEAAEDRQCEPGEEPQRTPGALNINHEADCNPANIF